MTSSIIHVEPNAAGRWIVRHDDEPQALSEHESATDAERVARALAERDHASFVFLHDRYTRIHRLAIEAPNEQRGTTAKQRAASRRPRPPATSR
jgi:hypothetical protein